MSKKMKQFIMALLVVVMSVSILAVPAAAATNDLTAKIPVEIQIDPHYVPAEKETYEIKVTPDSSDFPMPSGGSNGIYKITGAGSMDLEFTFPGLGVYTYEISQVDRDSQDDCYEDDIVYEMLVYVLNEDPENPSNGGIIIYRVILRPKGSTDEADKLDKAVFVNKYAKPVTVGLHATKIYNNKTPKTDLFEFMLKDGNGNLIETVSNVGRDVTFTPKVYDKVGTYTYKISEVIGKRTAVIYDKSVYTVTVEVDRKIDLEGDYTANVTYKKGGRVIDAEDLIFVNKSKTGGNPFTGDQFRLVLWSSIMVGSLIAIVVLLFVWKKRKK